MKWSKKILLLPPVAVALYCAAGLFYETRGIDRFLGDQKDVLRIYSEPVLREPVKPVGEVSDELRALTDTMLEVMYASKGIGLASVQIGRTEAVFVIDSTQYHGLEGVQMPLIAFNPEIITHSEETSVSEESCLSLPVVKVQVRRFEDITLRYLDRDGVQREITASGSLSRAIQHEVDHLQGVKIVDHAGDTERLFLASRLGRFTLRIFRKAGQLINGDA